jgi:hypothetical protein
MVLEERSRPIRGPMTSDLDIYRTAAMLVREYGPNRRR